MRSSVGIERGRFFCYAPLATLLAAPIGWSPSWAVRSRLLAFILMVWKFVCLHGFDCVGVAIFKNFHDTFTMCAISLISAGCAGEHAN